MEKLLGTVMVVRIGGVSFQTFEADMYFTFVFAKYIFPCILGL
jgi:hypothetical protein